VSRNNETKNNDKIKKHCGICNILVLEDEFYHHIKSNLHKMKTTRIFIESTEEDTSQVESGAESEKERNFTASDSAIYKSGHKSHHSRKKSNTSVLPYII